MKIVILGTGYVGLVTGSCFASMGNEVICVDTNKSKIKDLNKGKIPLFEPGLEKIIKESRKNKCLFFSNDIKEATIKSDIIFIAVGTPSKEDGSCDLSYVFEVARDIGKYINSNKIIVVKSTVPVGTTIEVQRIIKKEIIRNNKSIDFSICNNPEFLKQGKAVSDFISPDRIIIGFEDKKIKPILTRLYKPFSINHEKLIFMDIASSELTKYAANAMLATKISFINEIANIAEKSGADINYVRLGIGADNRIGYSYIYPSVGYGGNCLSKDVNSLINFSINRDYYPGVLTAVDKVNSNQRKYFFNKFFRRFKLKNGSLEGLKFGIWGLSFKPGTDDIRGSVGIYFIKKIIDLKGIVYAYDPKAIENTKLYFKDVENINYCSNKMNAIDKTDALLLLTEWPEFRSPDFDMIKSLLRSPIIFDGRNQYNKDDMKKKSFEYYQIGVKLI